MKTALVPQFWQHACDDRIALRSAYKQDTTWNILIKPLSERDHTCYKFSPRKFLMFPKIKKNVENVCKEPEIKVVPM